MYEAAGSEQVISLSGVDSIPMETLKSFDYVALGHIHKPQRLGQNIHYSGSPIPLRFSETYPKSVMLLELKGGEISSRPLPVPVFRRLVQLRATEHNWREKVDELSPSTGLTPMVEVQLTLESPRAGLIDELKAALEERGFELLSFLPSYQGEHQGARRHERLFELSPLELFQEFYAVKFPDSPEVPQELFEDFRNLLEKVTDASSET
jgi:exonuclease SbcD